MSRIVLSLVLLALWQAPAFAQTPAPTFEPSEEKPEDYPPGPGRDDTFYGCTPCHGFKIVAQQAQTRRQWEETLDWMTQKHNMPPPDEQMRRTMLDYLEATYPPRAPRGWQNPFLPR
jgi:hypothetical protein